MPTALLPGIGASIRRDRAARAIARSSASASIRLTLTCGAGWTSYWVTTGPALRPMIWAGMSKLASFLTMISSLRRWIEVITAQHDLLDRCIEQLERRQDVFTPLDGRR